MTKTTYLPNMTCTSNGKVTKYKTINQFLQPYKGLLVTEMGTMLESRERPDGATLPPPVLLIST